jgi:hypothetical protein
LQGKFIPEKEKEKEEEKERTTTQQKRQNVRREDQPDHNFSIYQTPWTLLSQKKKIKLK